MSLDDWVLVIAVVCALLTTASALYTIHGRRGALRRRLDELLGARGRGDRWRSVCKGREVELRVTWVDDFVRLEAGVQVAHAGPDFTITRAGMGRQLGRYVRLVSDPSIGDRRLDDRFVFDGDPGALRQLFAETNLEAMMHRGATQRTELRAGVLWTTTSFPLDASAEVLVEFLREELVALARHCEREEVEVRVREAEQVTKHFVWVGRADQARCPFCREELDLEASDNSACPECDTVHHGDCFDEHGGCTVLGCSSAPQPEARERA